VIPPRRRCEVETSSLLPKMETPSAFDYRIRYLVPQHQRSTFDRTIAALPPAFLGFPTTGEVFDSAASCKARLQGFSLGQGFAVVVGKSNKNQYVEFLCIHHDSETRNHRQLEQDVQLDPEGKIVSRRKRGDTQVNQKLDCQWRCICSFKFAYTGAVDRVWILTVTSLTHTHEMKNPFGYRVYVKGTTEFKIMAAKARHMRFAMIFYSDSKRMLEMEGLGFTIDSSTYYNTVRHNRPSSDDSQTI
jgi:hypothetical protein